VLGFGFRPFFLAASFAAVTLMLAWLAALRGWLAADVGWHAHEMIFGFAAAVIAGFLLTAVPSWTGAPRIGPVTLAALVVLWLGGRFVQWPTLASAAGAPGLVLDVAFVPALALSRRHTSPGGPDERPRSRESVDRARARMRGARTRSSPRAARAGRYTGFRSRTRISTRPRGFARPAAGKTRARHVPAADCTVARKLREAGTVLLGKLNTHEHAYGVTTDNPHYGATHNPWQIDCIPGGSSGGSGAAIAAGLATAVTGTDTGGSIRIPASLCGVVGSKPTHGRVSKAGVLPLSFAFDHAGPQTRTVEDAALMLKAIAGYDPADPASARIPVDDAAASLAAGVRGLRVGVPRGAFLERVDDEVAAAVERALAELARLGADVRELEIAGVGDAVGGLFGFVLAEAQQIHAETLRDRPEEIGADVRALLERPAPSAAELIAGLRARDALTAAMRSALESVDVLVTPTTPAPAPRIGQESVRIGGPDEPVIAALIRCTAPFNATHLPALSLPCGFTRAGLPIGLQIAGRPFDEATVLRVGHAYEQATDWHTRTPAL
jgi:aspartyl-tRNA(Asn)/glutamyl-tRNA(Gln) amidotransferase subunit A